MGLSGAAVASYAAGAIFRKLGSSVSFTSPDKTVNITYDPSSVIFSASMSAIQNELMNRQRPHIKVGEYMRDRIKQRIKTGRTTTGAPMKKLSPLTLRVRRIQKIAGNRPLLRKKGLLRSIKYTVNSQPLGPRGSQITVTRISPEKAGGPRMVRARVNQGRGHGTYITVGKGAKVPARPYIGFTKKEKIYVNNIFRQYIRAVLGKRGVRRRATPLVRPRFSQFRSVFGD